MDSPLERYLREVSARLSPMPRKRQLEELRELRGHLSSLADARREQGASWAEAESDAVSRFGDPVAVARDIVIAWERGLLRYAGLNAVAAAVALILVVSLLALTLAIDRHYLMHQIGSHVPVTAMVATWLMQLGLPICGAVYGYSFARLKSISYIGIAAAYLVAVVCISLFVAHRSLEPLQTFDVTLHNYIGCFITLALAAKLAAIRRQQLQKAPA